MRLRCLIFLGCFLACSGAVGVFAQPRIVEEVRELLAEGSVGKARERVKAWLLGNREDESFPYILNQYFELESDVSELERFFDLFLESDRSSSYVYLIWEKKAILAEMMGRIETARR